MAKQNAVTALRESIRLMEIRQEEEGKILKAQFKITYESLKPSTLIKNSLKDLVSSVEIKNSIFETVFSIISGYFTQKFIVNSKSGILKKLLGIVLQFGITNLITNNTEEVRTFITNLIDRFINPSREEEIPETEI